MGPIVYPAFAVDEPSAPGRALVTAANVTAQRSLLGIENLSFDAPLVRAGSLVSMPQASALQSGYLASTDWQVFSAKQPALGYTAADDSAVVHLTGAENITGPKTFADLTAAALSAGTATVTAAASIAGPLALGTSESEPGILKSVAGMFFNADSDDAGGDGRFVWATKRENTINGIELMQLSAAGLTLNGVPQNRLKSLWGGASQWETDYAGVFNFKQYQSGQSMILSLETAEGKLAGMTHFDVASASGRLLNIFSQPGVPIGVAPGGTSAAEFATDGSTTFNGTTRFLWSNRWRSYGQPQAYDTTFDGNNLTCNYATFYIRNNWGSILLSGATGVSVDPAVPFTAGAGTFSGRVKGLSLVVGPGDLGCSLDVQGTTSLAYSVASGLQYSHVATGSIYNLDVSAGSFAQLLLINRASAAGWVRLVAESKGASNTEFAVSLTGIERLRIKNNGDTVISGKTTIASGSTLEVLGPAYIGASGKTLVTEDASGALISQPTGGAIAMKVQSGWAVYCDNSLTVHLSSASAADGAVRVEANGTLHQLTSARWIMTGVGERKSQVGNGAGAWQAGYVEQYNAAGVRCGFYDAPPVPRQQLDSTSTTLAADLLAALTNLGLVETL